MKIQTAKSARNILAGFWLGVGLLFLLTILLKTPQFGEDAGKVFAQAPTLVTPILALVLTYWYGGKATNQPLQNPASFYAALFISVVHTVAISVVVFSWTSGGKMPMVQALSRAAEFMPYFSTITIASLNYCLLGITIQEKELESPRGKVPGKEKAKK
jgi:hypothetical protein